MLKIVTLLLLLLFIAAGCGNIQEFKDGYQFGDITRMTTRGLVELERSRRVYCDKTAHSALRAVALSLIRQQLPVYPVNGICTTLPGVISNQLSNNRQAPNAQSRHHSNIRDGPQPAS